MTPQDEADSIALREAGRVIARTVANGFGFADGCRWLEDSAGLASDPSVSRLIRGYVPTLRHLGDLVGAGKGASAEAEATRATLRASAAYLDERSRAPIPRAALEVSSPIVDRLGAEAQRASAVAAAEEARATERAENLNTALYTADLVGSFLSPFYALSSAAQGQGAAAEAVAEVREAVAGEGGLLDRGRAAAASLFDGGREFLGELSDTARYVAIGLGLLGLGVVAVVLSKRGA